MARLASSVDVAIIGAGAAGLAAARTAREEGLSVTLLEASHRIGGRAYTEELAPGVPFDLGAHLMHSASLNPFVRLADDYGIAYRRGKRRDRVHFGDRWATEAENRSWEDFFERNNAAIDKAARAGRDVAVTEVTERKGRWTPVFDYWISILQSVDSDQVSTVDWASYNDTGEDWPVVDGYGALVARHGADVPVELNAAVERVDWGGKGIKVTTPKGVVAAKAAVIAVSTGVLASGMIRFDPPLPDWKLSAIEALPLGDGNRVAFHVDGDAFRLPDDRTVTVLDPTSEPMSFEIRPCGHDIVIARTAGRFSAWLERAGPEAMVELALERLKAVFGTGITRHVHSSAYSAWRGDPFIRGAYSAARPGEAHRRADMAAPIDDRLFFAGEAASTDFCASVHGAYLSGVAAARGVAKALVGTG